MEGCTIKREYDCLAPEGISIAKMPLTEEEEASVAFNDSVPRGSSAGIVHTAQHFMLKRYSAIMFMLHGIGGPSREFSRATTNYWSKYRFCHIYRLVRKLRPKLILEFGSGVSTVLMAELLALNEKEFGIEGKVISYEQSPGYHNAINSLFPDKLKKYAQLELRHVQLEWFGKYRGIYYDIDSYPAEADLVYIDGATRTRGNSESDFKYRRLNADIVRMHKKGSKVGMAFTDHRYATYPFYRHELGSDYDVELSKMWRSILITPKKL